MDSEPPSVVEEGYDAVYAAWPQAATLHRIWREQVIGADYPDGFEHISFASLAELHRLTDALRRRSRRRSRLWCRRIEFMGCGRPTRI